MAVRVLTDALRSVQKCHCEAAVGALAATLVATYSESDQYDRAQAVFTRYIEEPHTDRRRERRTTRRDGPAR